MTNVIRHAQARQIHVELHHEDTELLLTIQDNGIGFDVAAVGSEEIKKSLGLLGMRERVELVGGAFEIESTPGSGTKVCARFPFTPGERP